MKNKKAISPLIGYIMLVVFVIAMSPIVYNYLKTYTKQDMPKCVDGVSIFITDYSCEDIKRNKILSLELKNNGRFDISGFYIRATTSQDQKLASYNLAEYLSSGGGENAGDWIIFSGLSKNSFTTAQKSEFIFNITNTKIYSIEIIPTRYEERNNKREFSICDNSKIREEIVC